MKETLKSKKFKKGFLAGVATVLTLEGIVVTIGKAKGLFGVRLEDLEDFDLDDCDDEKDK